MNWYTRDHRYAASLRHRGGCEVSEEKDMLLGDLIELERDGASRKEAS
jgi:hypothetical protein